MSYLKRSAGFLLVSFALVLAGLAPAGSVHAQEISEPPSPATAAVAAFNIGQDLHEKGDLKGAAVQYSAALTYLKDFPEAHLQLGSIYRSTGRTAAAEKAFRSALLLRPEWTLAMTNLGSLLVSTGRYSDAISILKRAVELEPQNQSAFASLTVASIRSKADAAAKSDLLQKLRALSTKASPTSLLLAAQAELELDLGHRAAARESAERALAIDQANAAALEVLFESALFDRDASRAADIVSRIALIPSESSRIPLFRARSLLSQGKAVEALALLNAVPSPTAEITALRDKIMLSGSNDIQELEKRLAATPDDIDVLAGLCTGLRVSDPAKALKHCRAAAAIEPDNIAHQIGSGAALVQAKEYGPAVTHLRKILETAPENASVRANLATALFNLKLYEAAKREFIWLTQYQPERAAGYYFLAITHDHLGEPLDAMANYQQFLKRAQAEQFAQEIDRVKLRIPALEREIIQKKGKKS